MGYTIKEASEKTGLTIPTLRYYDKEGLLPGLQRRDSGYRGKYAGANLYDRDDGLIFKLTAARTKRIKTYSSFFFRLAR